MVKNVRWLYSKLGAADISIIGDGTVTGGLNEVYNGLNGKAKLSHTHTVSDLPVTNDMQANATTLIPSSAAVYSLYTTMSDLSSEIATLEEWINIDHSDPNTRYESKDLGVWSNTFDVDEFMVTYNHDNNYTGLSLGNYVTIQDGTYNVQWVIAGFDMEHNQTAADGTVYDNGYGICMIPKTSLTAGRWNYEDTTAGGYMSSNMHTTELPTVVTNLKTVLGTHVVNRNVLLNDHYYSRTWTTTDATLMSVYQLTGSATTQNYNDDGEANYKLPLFNYESYGIGSGSRDKYWLRSIASTEACMVVKYNTIYRKYEIGRYTANSMDIKMRPLIYLR